MGLSRWGTHLDNVMQRAAGMPRKPPPKPPLGALHREGKKWWVRRQAGWTPYEPTDREVASWRVTQEAEETAARDKITETLTRSLRQASEGEFAIYVAFDWLTLAYTVTAKEVPWLSEKGAEVQLTIRDEDLARHTTDKVTYRKFLDDTLKQIRTFMPRQASDGGVRGVHPSKVLVDEVQSFSIHDVLREQQQQEDEAIASIRAAMCASDERPDP